MLMHHFAWRTCCRYSLWYACCMRHAAVDVSVINIKGMINEVMCTSDYPGALLLES